MSRSVGLGLLQLRGTSDWGISIIKKRKNKNAEPHIIYHSFSGGVGLKITRSGEDITLSDVVFSINNGDVKIKLHNLSTNNIDSLRNTMKTLNGSSGGAKATAGRLPLSSLPLPHSNTKSNSWDENQNKRRLSWEKPETKLARMEAPKVPSDSVKSTPGTIPNCLRLAETPVIKIKVPSKYDKVSEHSKESVQLHAGQQEILKLVSLKKNIFFTGAAGTGKSFLLREIIKILPKEGTCVTASTGVAAYNIGGTTLHEWAGVGQSISKVEDLISKIDRSKELLSRWRYTKTLVIDEISMIDGDLFDLLEKTARIVRASVRPFGGIQVIVSGDFFQLPPVKKHGSVVDPKFAFEAESWEDVIDHKRELTHVYRQSDSAFVAVLNEIRRGVCSSESLKLLKTCVNRSFSTTDNIAASQLFTHRADVDALNTKMLNGLEGEVVVFTAKDAGQVILQSQLNQFARGKIELKVGTQVVLNKSIRSKDGLVNGARGVVTKFINSVTRYPVVRFANGVEAVIKTETWSIMSGGKEIASRSQIPLDLGWALSIHKSQGMTLDRVSINLCKVFEFGQSYVALSRAKSLEGLCIQSYINAQSIKAHPKVIAFYQSCL